MKKQTEKKRESKANTCRMKRKHEGTGVHTYLSDFRVPDCSA